jgi:hypothetical protein
MYYVLNGYIEINSKGKAFKIDGFHSVEVENDIFKINQSCKIQIPTSRRLTNTDNYPGKSIQAPIPFNRGDKISVWIGYDNDLKLEFDGFIYRVNYKTPLEIECEGYEFQLRSPCETKTWKITTVKEVLTYLIAGTDITINENVPDISLVKYVIKAGVNKLQALQELKENTRTECFFMGKSLYIGLAYTIDKGAIKYKLGYNTINADDLKYHNADDVQVKVKAMYVKPDGTNVEVSVGDNDGQEHIVKSKNISDLDALKGFASSVLQKYKYSGYEGKIKTFLQPYATPCMKAIIEDPKYPERNGTYYITKTKVVVNRSGGRRDVEISIKLS